MSCLRFCRTVPLAALLFSCLLSSRSNAGEQSHDAIAIGSRKQLFLDERLIASSRDVRLEMNTPYVMRDPVLVADQPWENPEDTFVWSYSSVMRVDGKTRLWYHVNKLKFRPQPVGFIITDKWLAYAESKDGIHFTKPKLELNEYQGGRANNIVIPGVEGGHVWIDPRARGEHRYRFQTYGGAGKLAFYGSPDGIRWMKTHTAVVGHNDTQNIAFWDAAVKRYLLFTRKWPGNFRVHRRLDSKDLVHWKNEVVVMQADGTDIAKFRSASRVKPVDYYGACVFKYPDEHGLFVMLPQAFWHWYARGKPQRVGPNLYDVRLCVSRDGRQFRRVADRSVFLRPGPEGAFCSGSVWALPAPVRMGDELWFYFQGSNADHDGNLIPGSDKFRTGIGRAVLRLDGFLSVDAGFNGGEIVTPLMRFQGKRLELNVDSGGGGVVMVELLDEQGHPIPGFTVKEATPLCCNSVRKTVTWGQNGDVSRLASRPVKIRFRMRDCKLYAFQFRP